MRNYFTFKGVPSFTCGVIATELPEITLAAERVTFTDVPGRSGSLASTEGKDVYADVNCSIECYVENPEAYAAQIANFLKGSGKLQLPNREGGYYMARVTSQIPMEKIMRGRTPRNFSVTFRRKPFFYLDAGDNETQYTQSATIVNPTGFVSKPTITIRGSGDITLLVGTQIVELTGITDGITLDGENMEAFYNDTLKNDQVNGDFPVFNPGNNAVSWTGSVTSVSITPHWVTL